VEEAHPQTEPRSQARYVVDTEASLVIFNHGPALRARMFELSLDGCRVRADRYVACTTPVGVEVTFKVSGIGFRLAGTMQWLDARQTAGIQFSPMAPRRLEALKDLLDELETQKNAEQNADKLAQAAGKNGKPAGGTRAGTADSAPEQPGTLSRAAVPKSEIQSIAASPDWGLFAPRDIHPAEPLAKPAAVPGLAGRPIGRDRREQARHSVDTGATVLFIDVRAQISGRILDLSMCGCRIRTNDRFPVGIYRRVETEFKLDGMPFRLAGVVQSLHDKFTVGIRFLDMSPRKREQLQ